MTILTPMMNTMRLLLLFVLFMPVMTQGAEVNILLSKDLPDLGNKQADILTVDYKPGESSPGHRHNAHTFVYVLDGSVVMQVEGGEALTLTAGQTFYETPDDIHVVSRNASASEPARIVVFSIREKGAPLSIPVN